MFNSANPMEEIWPSPYDTLNNFHKVILLKLIRPDKAVLAVKVFFSLILGFNYSCIRGKVYSVSST